MAAAVGMGVAASPPAAAGPSPTGLGSITAVAFDAFTVFDRQPVDDAAEEVFPASGAALTDAWSARQFEYTWLRTLTRTLRWKPYLKPGAREDANQIREYPVRFTDLDLFDHMNNAVYWSVIEDYLSTTPGLLKAPLRVTIEHEAPVALGDKLEIIAHTHPAGSTDKFGPDLVDRAVTTLTYVVGDETKAIAAIFAL